MNAITALGKYLYALPIMIFGIFHFLNGQGMAGMVPIPGGIFWVYLTGVGLLAAGLAVLIGKYDKLAMVLLALMLVIFALSIHLPGVMNSDQASMPNLLKDLALAGGALMYARGLASDTSIIG